ncbi:MAG: cyclophilin-like fold protein [Candidatus Onthomonas sp.]
MKKLRSLMLAAAILLSLAGCGADRNDGQPEHMDSAPEAETADTADAGSDLTEDTALQPPAEDPAPDTPESDLEEQTSMKMNVQVGGAVFTAALEENEAVSSLVELLEDGPLVLQLSDYSGFEKVGPLGTSLPTSNEQTTTHAGDIVLYNGNQIVLFYGSNSWSYTRLGQIEDLTGWEQALGTGDVTVTFSLE